jgi:type III pantothenate kinase
LCIDVGNSRAKACLFVLGEVVAEDRQFTPARAQEWVDMYQPVGTIICSVGEGKEAFLEILQGPTQCIEAGLHLELPFKNLYRSKTLGADRLAAIAGTLLHLKPPFLTIDAGTCLTYDLLDADNEYVGGAISPGLVMRLRALNQFTAGLPLLSPAEEAPLAGLSTEDCMMSGALNGIIFEVQAYQARFAAAHKGLQTSLCGGGAYVFAHRLPQPIFVYPNLVLEGLLLLYWYQQAQANV